MEVSSHALTLGRVDGVDFAVGGFTNLSRDHLDFHPTMEDYFDAKARLFDPGSPTHAAASVVCVDDDAGRAMAALASDPVTVSATGARRRLARRGRAHGRARRAGVLRRRSRRRAPRAAHRLPGRYNVANCLLAAGAAGRGRGVARAGRAGTAGCARCPAGWSRSTAARTSSRWSTTPTSRARCAPCCETLREQTTGRLAVVFGAGGNRDPGKREPMGGVAAELADLVVVTDDNPRDEDPAAIRAAILAGRRRRRRRRSSRSATGARPSTTPSAGPAPGDVVLIAGKGHEAGQTSHGQTRPFDDRDELAGVARGAGVARVIDLTLAQIADIVGGELADISAADAAATRVTGTVEFDSRAVTPGGLFLALPGARSDGHDFAAAAVAAGAVAVLAARPVGVPAIVVTPRTARGDRHRGRRSRARHRRLGRGGARRAGQAGRRGGRRAGGGRADDRRHHRLVGQDVDQGPAGRGARAAGRGGRPAGLVQQRARPSRGRCCGRPRTPTTWCWRCRRATPATSPRWPRSRRRRSRWCSTSAPPTSASSARAKPSRDTKAELPQAVPASGVVILNVDDHAVAAMADQTAARVVRVVAVTGGADVWAGHVIARRAGPARASRCTPAGARPTSRWRCTATTRCPTRCARPPSRWNAAPPANRWRPRWPAAGPVSRHRMHVSTRERRRHRHQRRLQRQPGLDAGRPEGAGLDGPPGPGTETAAQLGGAGRDGRARRRRDIRARPHRPAGGAIRCVSRLIVVGTGRSMSAMHHGAVMEGSWGGEATMVADADAALALLRAELRAGDVVLVKARTRRGWATLADALIGDARMRQILIAVGIALAVSILLTPALIRLFTRQGFGHEIREDGPPSHHKKRGTPSMGGVAILAGIWAGYLGTHLVGLALDGEGPSASGLLVLGPGDRARRRRLRRRPDQDPPVAQPRPEQDRQDRRHAGGRRAVRRAGAAVPQRRRADAGQRRTVLRARDRHGHTGSRAVRAVLRR